MVILLYKWLLFFPALLGGGPSATLNANSTARHPLFVSVTEMNYNATDKDLEISCKIFTDDFEKTLAATYHTKVDLSAPSGKYVGFEKENDATWSYFQVSNAATAPKKIDVVNSILYESYDKQMNLMHVSVGGDRKSTRLNYPDKVASFQF
jgi:hypothetical protein